MNTLSVLIVEDEQPNVNRLRRLLQAIRPDHQVVAVLGTVHESVDWLQTNVKPQLIFMDIRLADGICFDIFSQVSVTSPIIFTTAYDEYMMQAFKVNSIDYLLKPIDSDELKQALDKFDQLQTAHDSSASDSPDRHQSDSSALYAELVDLYRKQLKVFRQRFLLPFRDGYVTLSAQDVVYFFSETKITFADLKSGDKTMVPYTLEELEEELDPRYFFRANRQYIIHVDSIHSIHNYFNGKLKVLVGKKDAVEIIISKEKAPLFKQWLNQ
ncbi:LytR/AlgR family response regulator transcription factor [Spirosoma pomorum]